MDRIVAVFEEAVRRQDRGDRQPLPMWGQHGAQDPDALASVTQCGPQLAQASLEQQQHAVRSLFNGPGDGPFARFLYATMAGDDDAIRRAARDLCASPEATAWLQSGREQLNAMEQAGAVSHQAKEATAQVTRQDDAGPPLGPGRMC